mmetsp:Transcript_31759/g.48722  ORF Transcript_31759/g.48722 Transcript_31759/m.48722 type:complete len:85 (-) Transcript_31759:974-1228(-)
MRIKTAEQVTQLVEKCQDSLDELFISLFHTKGVLDQVLDIKKQNLQMDTMEDIVEDDEGGDSPQRKNVASLLPKIYQLAWQWPT